MKKNILKNLIIILIMLNNFISNSQNTNEMYFFKVVNFEHFELISEKAPDITENSYLEYENDTNSQLTNEFYEDLRLFSLEKDLNSIEYEIFIHYFPYYLFKEKYYNNVKEIKKYFLEKYRVNFFYEKKSEVQNLRDIVYRKLDSRVTKKNISYNDFSAIIKPNLKIDLISAKKMKNYYRIGYGVIYNFDCFWSNNINGLLEYRALMLRRDKYEKKIDLKNKIIYDLNVITNINNYNPECFIINKEEFDNKIIHNNLVSILKYWTYDNKITFNFQANKAWFNKTVSDEKISEQFNKLEELCKKLNIKPFIIIN